MASVLVVDDEPVLRRALRHLLEDAGYAVREANTLAEADATLAGPRGAQLAAVLLEAQSFGSERQVEAVVASARVRHPNLCIVVTSTSLSRLRQRAFLALGADVCLDKVDLANRLVDELASRTRH
jgi:CheY-like chemotaxis protein